MSNPYIHQRPIRDPDNLIGREDGLERAKYILDQSVSSNPSYNNMGIVGEEGVGKTSLSNVVHYKASERDILPVRLEIDNQHVSDYEKFFKLVLNRLTDSIGGEARESYLEQVKERTKESELNLKLLRVTFDGAKQEEVTASMLKDDLSKLYQEAEEKAILLTIDNAQLLANKPHIIQKLKNVFSGIEGYILNLVGTEETFKVISEGFSSTTRNFHKIELSSFEEVEKTKETVIRPLDDEEIEDLKLGSIEEIHLITQGHPFEVNLLSYHMYKKYEQGKTETLCLDEHVIQEAFSQLEEWKENLRTGIVNELDKLSSKDIEVLLSSLEYRLSDSFYNYYQIKKFELINPQVISKEEIERKLDDLEEKDLIEKGDPEIKFKGNIYSKAYLKYKSIINDKINNLGYIEGGQEKREILNIHKNLIDDILLGQTSNAHSHFRIDKDNEFKNFKHSFSPIPTTFVKDKDTSAHKNQLNSSLGEKNLHNYQLRAYNDLDWVLGDEKEFDSPKEFLTFRYNIEWLGKGVYCEIIIEENDEDLKNQIDSLINELKSYEEILNVEIIREDENHWLRKAKKTCGEDAQKAVQYLSESINVNPNFIIARYNRAYHRYLDLEDDKKEEAKRDLNKIISLNQNYVEAYILKAVILLDEGRTHLASRTIEKGKEKSENNANFYERLGCLLGKDKKWEKSLEYLKNSKPESSPHALFHKSLNHYMLEENEKARNNADKILKITEKDSLYHRRGYELKIKAYMLEKESIDQAIQLYLEYMDDYPKRARHNLSGVMKAFLDSEEVKEKLMEDK